MERSDRKAELSPAKVSSAWDFDTKMIAMSARGTTVNVINAVTENRSWRSHGHRVE